MNEKTTPSVDTEVFEHPQKEVLTDHYEILLLIAQDFSQEQATAIFEDVKGFVSAVEGTVTAERPMGKRQLAYRVKGGHSGTYFALECDMNRNAVAQVHEKMRIRKDIARYMIVKKPVLTQAEKDAYEELRQQLMSEGRAEREKEEAEKKPTRPRSVEAAAVLPVVEESKEAPSSEQINEQIDKILSDDVEV